MLFLCYALKDKSPLKNNKLNGLDTFINCCYEIFDAHKTKYTKTTSIQETENLASNGDTLFLCSFMINDKKTAQLLHNMKVQSNIKIIVYNTEDIANSVTWQELLLDFLNNTAYCVMDFSQQRLKILSNPNKKYVPFGYHPYLESITRSMTPLLVHSKKPIDVLMYGSMSKRRLKIKQELEEMGLKVVCKTRYFNHNKQLEDILNSKVVLDAYYYGPTGIDFFRCSLLAVNKVLFVHETPAYEDSDEDFLRIVPHAHYDNLTQLCLEWVEAPSINRSAKANEIYELFKSKYNLQDYFIF